MPVVGPLLSDCNGCQLHRQEGDINPSLVPMLFPNFSELFFLLQYATKAGEEPGNEANKPMNQRRKQALLNTN